MMREKRERKEKAEQDATATRRSNDARSKRLSNRTNKKEDQQQKHIRWTEKSMFIRNSLFLLLLACLGTYLLVKGMEGGEWTEINVGFVMESITSARAWVHKKLVEINSTATADAPTCPPCNPSTLFDQVAKKVFAENNCVRVSEDLVRKLHSVVAGTLRKAVEKLTSSEVTKIFVKCLRDHRRRSEDEFVCFQDIAKGNPLGFLIQCVCPDTLPLLLAHNTTPGNE